MVMMMMMMMMMPMTMMMTMMMMMMTTMTTTMMMMLMTDNDDDDDKDDDYREDDAMMLMMIPINCIFLIQCGRIAQEILASTGVPVTTKEVEATPVAVAPPTRVCIAKQKVRAESLTKLCKTDGVLG